MEQKTAAEKWEEILRGRLASKSRAELIDMIVKLRKEQANLSHFLGGADNAEGVNDIGHKMPM